jgi:hypothetical protein
MAQFPLLPLLIPLCSPFVSPSTYLAPSSCDRNRPPPSQVACKLTLFGPPFTQLSHPLQIPRTPTAQRLTMTTSGIFRLLLSGTILLQHTSRICASSVNLSHMEGSPLENIENYIFIKTLLYKKNIILMSWHFYRQI